MQSFASIAAKCAVFRLKNHTWLSDFHGVPSATGYLATKPPLLGVEAVALYFDAKEEGEFGAAFAIAAILMFLTLIINLSASLVGKYFAKRRSV